MSVLTSFPKQHELINQQVREIKIYNPLDQGYGDIDLVVRLKNGLNYVFTFYTPDGLKDTMRYLGQRFVVELGVIVVEELTVDCILEAIEECLRQGAIVGLEYYGVWNHYDNSDE